jgi:glyoxylase-like metal-dependent hydrolase (beta-lactamase superfamily II)
VVTSLRRISDDLMSGAIAPDDRPPTAPLFVAEAVAPRTYFASSFANVTAFATDAGLVLVDTGSFVLADRTRALLRERDGAPVDTAVFTHGHVDHCFGVDLYEREAGARPVRVVAHEAIERRFARYRMTRGYNARINERQFQIPVEFPDAFRSPDVTYRDRLDLDVGGRQFELHHALGETDDHTWVWVPDAGVLCTGDLFIWASPNCGNPQKVQRYPREWAIALREMAKLDAEVLCPGHGVPIWGREPVRRALVETAELLESLVEQVVGLMNAGARLDRVLAEVVAPAHLIARPYLAPIYDEPEFVVRNLWRLYGGWWDGNPANLKPARDAELARELAALAGGADRLAARAEQLAGEGALALASHLAELASLAAPDDPHARAARAGIYTERAKRERSLMARGVFTTAADESRNKSR